MTRKAVAALVLAAAVAGCGDDDVDPPEPRATAPGADLQLRVQVRDGQDDLWRDQARVRAGDDVDIRLLVANTGGRQSEAVRARLVLPDDLEYLRGTAAEYKVPPPGTGAPIAGDDVLATSGFNVRPLPAGGETEYQLAARVERSGSGEESVRAVLTGEGGTARDAATVRVGA